METFNQPTSIEFNFKSINHLKETRKWAMFISIIGFIFVGLCIILTPIVLLSTFSGSSLTELATVIPLLLVSVIYFFPIYFLFKFASHSRIAIEENNSESLENSFRYLKLHYRFMGIFIIVILGIYLLAGIVAIISSSMT